MRVKGFLSIIVGPAIDWEFTAIGVPCLALLGMTYTHSRELFGVKLSASAAIPVLACRRIYECY